MRVTVFVTPLMRIKRPEVVDHISPFVGDVGAVPCGIRSGARLAVAAGAMTVPAKVAAVRLSDNCSVLLTVLNRWVFP